MQGCSQHTSQVVAPKWAAAAALILLALTAGACGQKRPPATAEISDASPPPVSTSPSEIPSSDAPAAEPPAAQSSAAEQPAADAAAPATDDVLESRDAGAIARDGPARASPSAPSSPPSSPPPPITPSVGLPDDYEIVSNVLLPAESYLPKSDGMPTGLVLLDSREKTKNDSLCKALLGQRTATVRTEAAARRDNPRGDYLVTHWPVKAAVANEGDCAQLSASYDFDRAKRVKQAYALQDRRGPLFLALDPTGEIVFLDLEDASAQEVFKATSDWMALALAAPQSGPNAGKPPQSLMAGANKLFAKLAGGFSSLVGGNSSVTVVRFNDPVAGTSRQFNIYKSGVYLIGATFVL